MTREEIALQLGVSVATVDRDLKSALRKLRAQDYSITLAWVHATAIEGLCPLQCGSAECDRQFIEQYAERARL
jgi:hypothetical protein